MIPSHERKRTNYIGRKAELSLLSDILDNVRDGKGNLVLIAGEAGIGKTRLIEEMKHLDAFSTFNLLTGRCLYFKDTDIYLPFKEIFNQYKGIMKNIEVESPFFIRSENSREGSLIREEDFVPMSLIPAEVEYPEETREGMNVEGLMDFDKMSEFIFKLSDRGPLCLFIDDLHWADPPSIKLLQYLAQKITDHPILIVCTYRPEDLFWAEDTPHPLTDPLKRLSRDKLFIPMELKRLSREETDELISEILEVERIPRSFGRLIYKRTNGNPFFVEEVIYSLLERNIIDPSVPDWHKNIDPQTISLPTTLKDIILRRMHWLSSSSIAVLRLSSVSSGTLITFEIIKDALNLSDEEVLEALEELVRAKFLREIPDEESYDFENPVIQEVVYSELNHSRRRFLHNKMAHVLEERFSKNPSYWGSIGIHFYKGKEFEKALKYLIKASSHFSRVAPQKALDYLTMVLICMENLPQSDSIKEQNLEVLIETSNLCLKISEWDRALQFAEKALNLATVLRRNRVKMKAKVNIGEVLRCRGEYDKALGAYQDVFSNMQEEDPETFAQAYMGMGYIHWRRGEFPRALELFSRSLQYAKLQNNLSTIGALYLNIGNVFNHRGDLDKAIDYYRRGSKHLESHGNLLEACRGYSNMGGVYLQKGELDKAEEMLRTALNKSKEQGRSDPWWPQILMIKLHALRDEFREAERIFDMVNEELKGREDRMAQGTSLLYFGLSRMREGKSEEAETLIMRALSIFESANTPLEITRAKEMLGDLYLRMGKYDAARTYLNEAYQTLKSIGAKKFTEDVRRKLLELREGDGYI
ncbi:MAG TPA: tetratricopeptide repeat protein [Euryarchaeota archaeon]|nr:tetratricopeptide repeat protein [Euryarchaeota archaeon]